MQGEKRYNVAALQMMKQALTQNGGALETLPFQNRQNVQTAQSFLDSLNE